MALVALGFRAHSGWAAVVAVAAPARAPMVVLRRRIELADPAIPGSLQPYHAGENLALDAAERIVTLCTQRTGELALQAVRGLVDDLRGSGHDLGGCGILIASDRPPGTVAEILGNHPWMHAAEGQFFRNALAAACTACGLPVTRLPERAAYVLGASYLALSEAGLQAELKAMGQALGAPWRQDEKLATLVAWISLSSVSQPDGER